MSKKLNRVALMALLIIALPSWASDNLPTSKNLATGKWTKMRPASFAPTLASAMEQCKRSAALDPNDPLTPEKCVKMEELLRGSECRKVLVRDGKIFDQMNGRENGRSFIRKNVEKSLGRADPALLCDPGDQVSIYWFIGDKGRSCNNIGIVFTAPPGLPTPTPVAGACGSNAKRYSHLETDWPAQGSFCTAGEQSSPSILFPQAGSTSKWSCQGKDGGQSASCEAPRDDLPAPQPAASTPRVQVPVQRCGWVSRRYIVPQPGQVIIIPGLLVAVCRGYVPIPDVFVSIPSDVMTVTRSEHVCRSSN